MDFRALRQEIIELEGAIEGTMSAIEKLPSSACEANVKRAEPKQSTSDAKTISQELPDPSKSEKQTPVELNINPITLLAKGGKLEGTPKLLFDLLNLGKAIKFPEQLLDTQAPPDYYLAHGRDGTSSRSFKMARVELRAVRMAFEFKMASIVFALHHCELNNKKHIFSLTVGSNCLLTHNVELEEGGQEMFLKTCLITKFRELKGATATVEQRKFWAAFIHFVLFRCLEHWIRKECGARFNSLVFTCPKFGKHASDVVFQWFLDEFLPQPQWLMGERRYTFNFV